MKKKYKDYFLFNIYSVLITVMVDAWNWWLGYLRFWRKWICGKRWRHEGMCSVLLSTLSIMKGGLFDANSGNPWCQQDCSRLHPAEVTKMIKALEAGNKDEAITCSKVKFNIVAIEKDNTLMHAFGPKNIPMVMKIVR